jgi:hypothetical protein
VAPDPQAASVAGDQVRPDSIIRVINAGVAPVTVTMVTPQTVDGDLAVADREIAVPDGEARLFKATRLYRNPSDNLVDLTWSDVTDVTFEVIK